MQQGHIYIHHTVYKDSPSPDSVVVFDEKGKFVRSFGPMFRGGAHGMHLRKEGNTEYLYFCDDKHGIITKRTLKGEEVWTIGLSAGFAGLPEGTWFHRSRRRGRLELPAHEYRDCAERRLLGRRRVRLVLHVPLLGRESDGLSEAGEHVRRPGAAPAGGWRRSQRRRRS